MLALKFGLIFNYSPRDMPMKICNETPEDMMQKAALFKYSCDIKALHNTYYVTQLLVHCCQNST